MAVEHDGGGTKWCSHKTTARKALTPNVWICLQCGKPVESSNQTTFEDVGVTRPDYWPTTPVNLPAPPIGKSRAR